MTLIHAWGLLLLAVVLMTLELFLPSGGLLGLSAAAAFVAAIVIGFLHSFTTGCAILILVGLGVPAFIWLGLKIWPRTPLGRKMLNIDHDQDALRREQEEQTRTRWVGKRGSATMDLLPNGRIEVEGISLDVISVAGVIERGQAVEIINVIAGKILVRRSDLPAPERRAQRPDPNQRTDQDRRLTDNRAGGTVEPGATNAPGASPVTDSPDRPATQQVHPLEFPIESLGGEDWEEPFR